jgi:hypothetical protein
MALVEVVTTIRVDGELALFNLPIKKGQQIKVQIEEIEPEPSMTAAEFLNSEFFGMWAGREDIEDSSEFSRQLREQLQNRDLDIP